MCATATSASLEDTPPNTLAIEFVDTEVCGWRVEIDDETQGEIVVPDVPQ